MGIKDLFRYELDKPIEINIPEVLERIAPNNEKLRTKYLDDIAKWDGRRSLQHKLQIKDILMMSPNEYLTNITSPSGRGRQNKLDIHLQNLQKELLAYTVSGQQTPALEEAIMRYKFELSSFVTKKKKSGKWNKLYQDLNDVMMPGIIAPSGSDSRIMMEELLKQKNGKLAFGYGYVTKNALKIGKISGGKVSIWDFLMETNKYKNESELLKDFGINGNKAIHGMLTRDPKHQNPFPSNLMYKIIDEQKYGIRAHNEQILTSPLDRSIQRADQDQDLMAQLFDEQKITQGNFEDAAKNKSRYFDKSGELNSIVKDEIRNFNKKWIPYKDGFVRLEVNNKDQEINYKFLPFSQTNRFINPLEGIESSSYGSVGQVFAIGHMNQQELFKYIEKQREQEFMSVLSKSAIPHLHRVAENATNNMYDLLKNGKDPTLLNMIMNKDGKFNKEATDALLDLWKASQSIISLKKDQKRSESKITETLSKIEKFKDLSNSAALKGLAEEGEIKVSTAAFFEKMSNYLNQFVADKNKISQGEGDRALASLLTSSNPSDFALLDLGKSYSKGFVASAYSILEDSKVFRPTISTEMQKGLWEKFSEKYSKEAAGISKTGKFFGIGALGFLGLNFFRPDQMSNKYNPLDLFVDLGPQEGFGGEEYDYFSKNYGLSRFTPIDIPQASFDAKTRLVMEDPYAKEKREEHNLGILDDMLNKEDLGMINMPTRNMVNYTYTNKLERINQLNISDIMNRSGAVLR
jgi:hypothetical protein